MEVAPPPVAELESEAQSMVTPLEVLKAHCAVVNLLAKPECKQLPECSSVCLKIVFSIAAGLIRRTLAPPYFLKINLHTQLFWPQKYSNANTLSSLHRQPPFLGGSHTATVLRS